MKLIFEPGKFYKTRDGRKAQFLGDFSVNLCRIDSLLFCVEGNDRWYFSGGNYRCSGDGIAGLDIVSEWKESLKISGWLNVYPDGSTGSLHPTREEAISWVASDRTITTIFVQGTEGK